MTDIPFFTIVTRTILERANVLARNQAALAAQTFKAFEQVLLLDTEHLGAAATHLKFHTLNPRGVYVWAIDDDDFLTDANVLQEVYDQLVATRPPFAVVKVKHAWAVLPEDDYWDKGMVPLNHIGTSGVVTRCDVWMQLRENWTNWYGGDHTFAASLFAHHEPIWIDRLTVEAPQQGHGERKV